MGHVTAHLNAEDGSPIVMRATYQLFMVLVTLLALTITAAYYLLPLPATADQVLYIVDNLVALVLYFFVGPFGPLLFWAVNGYLLGREYFETVATRRIGRQGAVALRRANAGTVWLAGALMAAPLSLPLVNLFVPVLGVATFTHIFHRLVGTRGL